MHQKRISRESSLGHQRGRPYAEPDRRRAPERLAATLTAISIHIDSYNESY